MGNARRIQRETSKQEYRTFAANWRREKAYQIWLIESGQPVSDVQLLLRRPTFKQWEKAATQFRKQVPVQPAEPIPQPDLEWTDE